MPVIDMETHALGGGSNFNFSGARIANLTATEYTLATIVVDLTGSTSGFVSELKNMVRLAIDGCKKSPRVDNLLVRVVTFNSSIGVRELHGFKPLSEIDSDKDYADFSASSLTNLFDATYSAVGAANAYAKALLDQDFSANAVTFIITDGEDNVSSVGPATIATEMEKSITGETLESHVSILIGVNVKSSRSALETFQREGKLTQFIDAGDATQGRLAKLAAFVSKSVSSTSQALGTGGPSQQISASI